MSSALERSLASTTTALVAVSPEVRDDLVALGVAPREKFTVIRLGVELEERVDRSPETRGRARRMMGIPDDRFTVGWMGRMTAVKRTGDIVFALKRLLDAGTDACLCLVGDGPDREPTEQLAHDLGIVDRCLFLGYQDDVAPFYAAFDALILPSANEGTPVSAIEALAGGKPVVATQVGGVSDVIRDGVDGFLVEPGDVKALADRLRRIADDRELARRMGEAGRARVLERYSVSRLVGDVDDLYRRLLAEVGLDDRGSRDGGHETP
jgi:glycosyltransferase involved in cell wall biosynthesis